MFKKRHGVDIFLLGVTRTPYWAITLNVVAKTYFWLSCLKPNFVRKVSLAQPGKEPETTTSKNPKFVRKMASTLKMHYSGL